MNNKNNTHIHTRIQAKDTEKTLGRESHKTRNVKCEMGYAQAKWIRFKIDTHIALSFTGLSHGSHPIWGIFSFCSFGWRFLRLLLNNDTLVVKSTTRAWSLQPSSRSLSASSLRLNCIYDDLESDHHQHVYIHNSFIHFSVLLLFRSLARSLCLHFCLFVLEVPEYVKCNQRMECVQW